MQNVSDEGIIKKKQKKIKVSSAEFFTQYSLNEHSKDISADALVCKASRKHAHIILTPLNPTFI